MQDILLKIWFDVCSDNPNVILGLNPFGQDKDIIETMLLDHNIRYKWISSETLPHEEISGIFLGSVHELLPEYVCYERITQLFVLRVRLGYNHEEVIQSGLKNWLKSNTRVTRGTYTPPDYSETFARIV